MLVGRALRPVEAIRAQVDEISATTMHRRVPSRTPTTRSRGSRTMNGMLDRLERASSCQRAFVSDASHELRSPVSTIRTELEVAAADSEHADWPEVARPTLGETDRLSRLVDDLLALARLDEATGPPVRVPSTSTTWCSRRPCARIGSRSGPRESSAGRVLGDAPATHPGRAQPRRQRERHATTQVAITLRRDDDQLVFVVDDDGPGIPEAEREHVFDRFTRLDEARGRADGGAGLGLAVVRRVGRASRRHRRSARQRPRVRGLGGARFVVRLPAL